MEVDELWIPEQSYCCGPCSSDEDGSWTRVDAAGAESDSMPELIADLRSSSSEGSGTDVASVETEPNDDFTVFVRGDRTYTVRVYADDTVACL